jgi:NAD(P)-dependent dehydrogenase (short-subunit alcohol dehydrogenase family)
MCGIRGKMRGVGVGQLQDRVVVVTGVGRGIGRAYAEYLSGQGARLVVNDTGTSIEGEGSSQAVAQTVADGIVAAGGTALADTHDVVTDAEALIAHALDEFGRIDGLVNNAEIVIMGGIDTVTEQIDRTIDVHVRGSLNTVRAVWPDDEPATPWAHRQRVVGIGVRRGRGRVLPDRRGGDPGTHSNAGCRRGTTRYHGEYVDADGIFAMADTPAGLGEFMKKVMPPERWP